MNTLLAEFHFLRPEWLWMMLPVFILCFLLWRIQGRATGWRQVISPELLPYLLDETTLHPRRWPLFVLALGGMLASLAMAGPAWERLPQPVFRSDAALVIVLDLSRSMDAQDIKPSRLQRAHYKIADILKYRQEGQTALVVYAGDAFTVTPLTDDDETILSQLPALTTDLPPVQGSRSDRAMQLAVQLFRQASLTRGQVLLITDEVASASGLESAQQLSAAGYQLNILGVGTADGAPVPTGNGMLKNEQGEIVIPTLDAANLKRIATAGGGRYATLTQNDSDIQQLAVIEVSQFEERTL
ncbi:MAG: vWA domain-containing protein, partial [Halioglobus sp.]